MYSSDRYNPGSKNSRCNQGVPDRPNSLLLYKDKKSANSFQLTALAVQARTQCRSPGGLTRGGKLYHHMLPFSQTWTGWRVGQGGTS